jgi:diadenosine tetraphosphate (Ap4A) HIT family hydrolase
MNSSDCVFCREISGSRDTNFHRLYPEYQERFAVKTQHILCFPCIGQLADNHSLFVTRNHCANFASAFREFGIADFGASLAKSRAAFVNHYHIADQSTILYFEHGALGHSSSGCGIYHAHIHAMPQSGHLAWQLIFDQLGLSGTAFRTLTEAIQSVPDTTEYVLVGSDSLGFGVGLLRAPMPSQSIRRIIAGLVDIETWNWRDTRREARMLRSLNTQAPLIRTNSLI